MLSVTGLRTIRFCCFSYLMTFSAIFYNGAFLNKFKCNLIISIPPPTANHIKSLTRSIFYEIQSITFSNSGFLFVLGIEIFMGEMWCSYCYFEKFTRYRSSFRQLPLINFIFSKIFDKITHFSDILVIKV